MDDVCGSCGNGRVKTPKQIKLEIEAAKLKLERLKHEFEIARIDERERGGQHHKIKFGEIIKAEDRRRISDIKERIRRSSPPPWRTETVDGDNVCVYSNAEGYEDIPIAQKVSGLGDVNLMVRAPLDSLYLVDLVDRLSDEIDRIKAEISK